MRPQATMSTLLLLTAGVLLGGTVLRDQVASARSLAQDVFVNNTPANPVPVREQNLDGSGSIRIHEQGTATVNVTNTPLEAVPVLDLMGPSQEPLRINVTLVPPERPPVVPPVPAGKRFIVTYISITSVSLAPERCTFENRIGGLVATIAMTEVVVGHAIANEQVFIPILGGGGEAELFVECTNVGSPTYVMVAGYFAPGPG